MDSNFKADMINNIIQTISEVFEQEIPPEILESEDGAALMYDSVMNLLYRISSACSIDKQQLHAHIDYFFDLIENNGKGGN